MTTKKKTTKTEREAAAYLVLRDILTRTPDALGQGAVPGDLIAECKRKIAEVEGR